MKRFERILISALIVIALAAPVAPAMGGPLWLDRLNQHRASAALPAVTADTALDGGCEAHAVYMVKNDYIGHIEDPDNAWYTAAGAAAAARSNVLISSAAYGDDRSIDSWVVGPFHAIGMLDPRLRTAGFGSYYESIGSFRYGAALNVLDGRGTVPVGVSFPVLWPGDGAVVDLYEYEGSEYPDPLAHTGWAAPSGLPLIAQFGTGSADPVVTASGLWCDGVAVEHAVFTESTYQNPDASAQSLGRAVLASRDAVVMLPREPLSEGHVYTASLTVEGQRHTWSFSTPGAVVQAVDTREIAGHDRYTTAVEASKATFAAASVDTVVIATALNWPDALGGSALAGALGSPILLVGSTVPDEVRAEIERLGASRAIVIGGERAVPVQVEAALESLLGEDAVERISGVDRYATARLIAYRVRTVVGPSFDGVAFIASGVNYPDALAASPLAAAQAWPVYLTAPSALAQADIDAMHAAGVSRVYLLGGEAAVSADVEARLAGEFRDGVERLSGSDRYATAAKIAEFASAEGLLSWQHPGIATGTDFPDALAGGVMQGLAGSVLLLSRGDVTCVSTGACMEVHAGEIDDLTFLGGVNAIGEAVRTTYARLAYP